MRSLEIQLQELNALESSENTIKSRLELVLAVQFCAGYVLSETGSDLMADIIRERDQASADLAQADRDIAKSQADLQSLRTELSSLKKPLLVGRDEYRQKKDDLERRIVAAEREGATLASARSTQADTLVRFDAELSQVKGRYQDDEAVFAACKDEIVARLMWKAAENATTGIKLAYLGREYAVVERWQDNADSDLLLRGLFDSQGWGYGLITAWTLLDCREAWENERSLITVGGKPISICDWALCYLFDYIVATNYLGPNIREVVDDKSFDVINEYWHSPGRREEQILYEDRLVTVCGNTVEYVKMCVYVFKVILNEFREMVARAAPGESVGVNIVNGVLLRGSSHEYFCRHFIGDNPMVLYILLRRHDYFLYLTNLGKALGEHLGDSEIVTWFAYEEHEYRLAIAD